jgi:steroid 5-alpha reductase family enzyme
MYNWTAVGMIGYLLVFQGSTPLTEGISGGKYPEYKLYQERVGKFLPSLFGKGWNEEEAIKLGPKYVEAAKKAANKSK